VAAQGHRADADLPFAKRVLQLKGGRNYPLDPAGETALGELRKAISAAQGNNPNRRIRILLPGWAMRISLT